MVALGMLMSPAKRRRHLELAAERIGGKAALGRLLGYKDGAFVGQMIRAERPITEKTIAALSQIREISDLFAFNTFSGFRPAENDEAVSTTTLVPRLADALPVVLDALAAAQPREKLRAALLALLEDDAPAYRQRLAELLAAPAAPQAAPTAAPAPAGPALAGVPGAPDQLRLRIGRPKDNDAPEKNDAQ